MVIIYTFPLSSMAEQRAVNSKVRGSNPRGGAEGYRYGKRMGLYPFFNTKGKNCLLKN
jgi:hypothetical protein